MFWGTTFSDLHANHIGLEPQQSLEILTSLNFDLIRLCCYWSEIQPKKDIYDFSAVEALLDFCEKRNQSVVLTIGMKAPRWPEYYIPAWVPQNELEYNTLNFIETTVQKLKSYSCIKYWQIENEPLDPSGPGNKTVPLDLLEKEVNLVKQIDSTRKIVLTLWGNELIKRGNLQKLCKLGDIIGLDLYYKVPQKRLFQTIFCGPTDTSTDIQQCIISAGKEIWITELQAEPWEPFNFYKNPSKIRSISIEKFKENLGKTQDLTVRKILLWGGEFWLWEYKRGNRAYLDVVSEVIKARNEALV